LGFDSILGFSGDLTYEVSILTGSSVTYLPATSLYLGTGTMIVKETI
jgi:hypothetical protein